MGAARPKMSPLYAGERVGLLIEASSLTFGSRQSAAVPTWSPSQ